MKVQSVSPISAIEMVMRKYANSRDGERRCKHLECHPERGLLRRDSSAQNLPNNKQGPHLTIKLDIVI